MFYKWAYNSPCKRKYLIYNKMHLIFKYVSICCMIAKTDYLLARFELVCHFRMTYNLDYIENCKDGIKLTNHGNKKDSS